MKQLKTVKNKDFKYLGSGFFFKLCVKSKIRYKKAKMMNGVKDGKRLARHICLIAERAGHVKGGRDYSLPPVSLVLYIICNFDFSGHYLWQILRCNRVWYTLGKIFDKNN